MHRVFLYRLGLVILMAASLWLPAFAATGTGPGAVLTQHNDNARTGAYLTETTLTPVNVAAGQLGKLFTRLVDGQIYAQPLYVPGRTISGGVHNVVYVATMHNSVYAFEADDPAAVDPLWHSTLGVSAPITYTLPNTTTAGHDFGPPDYDDITVEVGILSTPVIDLSRGALYVVAFTKEPDPATCPCHYAYRLHALDLTTGAEKFGGPVIISGTVPGAASDGQGGQVAFQPQQEDQRAGLLLDSGVVYVAFASYGDQTPYHGWLFGYNAATLQPVSAWNATPNGGLGGIWQSGQGLSADASGNLYLVTGNGTFDANQGNYGDSFIKLNPHAVISGVLSVADWFTPYDQAELDATDADLGSGGPVLVPATNLLLGGGKAGKLYLLNQGDLGGYQQGPGGSDRVLQSFQANVTTGSPLHGTPVFWNGPNGPLFFQWDANGPLKAYRLSIISPISATVTVTPSATSPAVLPRNLPGGFLSLSANGSAGGIVWAVHPTNEPGLPGDQGVLRAFEAANVSHELWTSVQFEARDAVGRFAKFNVPTVANGKVYVASFSDRLNVYGIMGAPWVITQPLSQTMLTGPAAPLTVVASGQAPLTYHWYQGASGDIQHPVGGNTASYTPALGPPAAYWVQVSNHLGQVNSTAAMVWPAHQALLPFLTK